MTMMADGATVESFVRAIKPDPELQRKLRDIGFDLERVELSYPIEFVERMVEVVRLHTFPSLSLPNALAALGRISAESTLNTITGRTLAIGLKTLPPRLLIDMLARRFPAVVEVLKEGETRRRMVVENDPFPDFSMSGLAYVMGITKAKPKFEIIRKTPTSYDVIVSW